MLHKIQAEKFGSRGEGMAHAVEACVHCGFCLPTCPTYLTMGEEMDSPRGRIFLMKEVLEGNLSVDQAAPYVDRCLGCLACETSCPSGVRYGHLISPYRAYAQKNRKNNLFQKTFRWLLMESLPHPGRFRFLLQMAVFSRPLQGLLPRMLRSPLSLLPKTIPKEDDLPEIFPAKGDQRARVALLTGCAQQVLAPEINRATLRVLSENGVEVVIPKSQGCCGALAMHLGEVERAKISARKNLEVFENAGPLDAIVTNAAGCGSGLSEYRDLFHGEPEEERAKNLFALVQDVSLFLHNLGLKKPSGWPEPRKIAYHDACHLSHAQGVREAPRELLRSIPNLILMEPLEWEVCCGSAGTYNLEHPETADLLGQRKAKNLADTGADAVATGNIGCLVQVRNQLEKTGSNIHVFHTMQILEEAYRNGA